MDSPISVNGRLLATKLDDLAYDHHELADILVEIGAGDAGGGGAVHFFSMFNNVCERGVVGILESEPDVVSERLWSLVGELGFAGQAKDQCV